MDSVSLLVGGCVWDAWLRLRPLPLLLRLEWGRDWGCGVGFCEGGLSLGGGEGAGWVSFCGMGGWELGLDCLRRSFGGVRFCDGGFWGVEGGVAGGGALGALAPAVASGDGGEGSESAMLLGCWGVWGGVCDQSSPLERLVMLSCEILRKGVGDATVAVFLRRETVGCSGRETSVTFALVQIPASPISWPLQH